MDTLTLKQQIDASPLTDRAALNRLYLCMTVMDDIKPEYESALAEASDYQDFLTRVYECASLANTPTWADIARLKRRNWLTYFEPKMLIQNLRLKTDGLPIEMGTGVVLAPTGSRDNIASLYVFEKDGFNHKAADFVTSLGGKFKVADHVFFGIYGLYKYRGSVILEEWEVEAPAVYDPSEKFQG